MFLVLETCEPKPEQFELGWYDFGWGSRLDRTLTLSKFHHEDGKLAFGASLVCNGEP